ncbi:MAG: GntR family transcriptional regulator [Defluviitaleaceae bacterium]|nr:GntR family transcriptional regulator [Defluviitaleaceae bacterium]
MNYNNQLPIYQQIIDNILLSIAKGDLLPGEKVASVREMAANFKVNPNTMQRSLAKLEEMGYLFSERTSGRFITKDVGIIARLKSSFPQQITKKYVDEMMEYGMIKDGIEDYVKNYIERMDGNG